jgi:hypothetical protein
VVDSGNGWHQLYRVDLPNDARSHAATKALLKKLAEDFDTEAAHVDTAVHNPSRIAKLPGSWARKGPPSDDRPWRMARLVSVPDELTAVPVELIQRAAGVAGEQTPPPCPPPAPAPPNGTATVLRVFRGQAGGEREKVYARRGLESVLGLLAAAPEGTRNNVLNDSAFRLGTMVGAGWIAREEVEPRLLAAALAIGLAERESAATVKSGLDAGTAQPRGPLAERNGTPSANGKAHAAPADAAPEPGKRVILLASEVVPRQVEWLWPGRIPRGKLTTFAGVGGLGKTFVLCDITARITRGLPWPDDPEGGECREPGKVLFISGEDDPDDTLVPRLIECRADLTRVAFLQPDVLDNFTLAAVKTLTAALEQIDGGTRLVVIDPPTSYLGGVNDHKNAELRGLLTPLKNWASANRVAIIFNTHVNKSQGKVEAMMRVMGSVAWVNAVRAAHMFATDPDDRERRFFIPMKMSNAKERKGLAYKITGLDNGQAKVDWLGEVDTTADEAVNREPGKPRRVVAAEWLVERFREKLEWPSDELFRAASAANVSRNALFEAKDKLCLPRARKVAHENGDVAWVWWVAPDWPPLRPTVPPPKTSPGQLGQLGQLDEKSF